jgi:type I restriction enzyme M protein
MDDVGGDVIGRIYEYFLNKFAKNIASDDGVFFTPKSLVKMIVNVLEPKSGVLLEIKTPFLIQIATPQTKGVQGWLNCA